MFILFKKDKYELPDPVPLPDEASLDVEKFFVFPQPTRDANKQFQFSHGPAKVLFFLFREGFALTMRKILATLLKRRILVEKKVVIAFGKLHGGESYAIAIGPQSCPSANVQTFPRAWINSVPRDFDMTSCRDMLASHFDAHPELLDEIFHYSPFSGLDVRFTLNDVMHNKTMASEYSRKGKGSDDPQFQLYNLPKDVTPVRARRLRGNAGNELFLVGAGAYAFAYILPFLHGVHHHTVVDLNPALAAIAAKKFGFTFADTSYERALKRLCECDSPLLVVATYHSTHLDIAKKAVRINPRTKIFLEKPPVTSLEQLEQLLLLRSKGAFIEIGFNRRYSRMIWKTRELICQQSGPLVMTCIVKELTLPASHWYYWPTQGTRITGNLCHWLDLGVFLIERSPITAIIFAPPDHPLGDEVTIVVDFEDGSRLTIVATDSGNPLRGVQETIDIRRGDLTIVINDFISLRVQKNGRQKLHRSLRRDKGHAVMYREFMENTARHDGPKYPDTDLNATGRLYLALTNAVCQGEHTVSDIQM